MDSYVFIAFITFFLSVLFSMGGAGSGIALIPILHFLGFDFTVAKASGLFAGATTTITSSIMNIKRGIVDFKSVIPIAITMLIFAPIGAYLNRYINQDIVKILFAIFLFYTASMMLFGKKKALFNSSSTVTLLAVGAFVGLLAGILGVGGGNILIPLLTMLGFEAKKVASSVSFVVPFSALGSFFTYASYTPLDYKLLLIIAICAVAGGYIGNYFMHFKLKQKDIKKVMAVILYLLAIKMFISLI